MAIKKYFIQQYMQQEYLHGGVGCADAEKILLSKGFRPIFFPHHHNFSFRAKMAKAFLGIKLLFAIKKKSIVIFLFPVYAKMNRLIIKGLRRKGVKLVCFITDVDGIRDGNERLLKKEIKFFKGFHFFITHNDSMKEWLYKNVSIDCVIVTIQFFDFLAQPYNGHRVLSYNITFCGNLDKSFFLKKLHRLSDQLHLKFDLYGQSQIGFSDTANAKWHGVKKPYLLPSKIYGSFGLVWDGESLEKLEGSMGHYMRYNSPHKLSSYILGKLPLIVPDTAASASLITKYKIGFLINDLHEIEDKIKNMSDDEYMEMQNNMRPLAEKISKGGFLSDAVDEIVSFAESA